MSGTSNSLNPTGDLTNRVNVKYHFPASAEQLERQIRLCLGLPFKGRLSGQQPYGFIYNKPTDTFEPQQDVFKLLWDARNYLYHSSSREVATWLNFKTAKIGYDQSLSHAGLHKLMYVRPPFEECLLPVEQKERLINTLTQWNQRPR